MGVGFGYVVPSAGLVRSQGLAVSGCGSGLICVWVLARLGGCDGSGLGFGAFGRSGARCRVRWRPSASGSFGDFWAGPGVAPRGGGLLGNGVRWRRRWPGGQARRVVWCAGLLGCCGCRRCRCADACGVVRVCVCVRGWALGDVPQADAVSLCLLEGLPQAPEDIRVVLERGEVAGVDSQGVERIGQHGFPCGLSHPPPRRPEAAVLHRPLAGPVDQALEGGHSPGPLSQLPELRVGPALPPLSLGGAAVLGGGVGVGGCDGVVGTGGGGGPGGFLVVLFRGGARGVGARADVDPRVCAHGLRLGVGRGLAAAAVAGHALYVGCHRGLVGGRGRCWWNLASFWPGWGRSVGLGCGL